MIASPPEASKPLSLTEMQKRARAFVLEWQDETSEHAEAQSWWNDFFEIFGVRRKGNAAFEWTATRASTGGLGSVDIFMPGVMIGEHKSLGKGGEKAVGQALDYLAGGDVSEAQMPRYVVTCDFGEIDLRDLESDDPPLTIPIKDLPKHVQKFAFLGGYEAPRRKAGVAEAVSIKAAREMAKLQQALYGDRDVDPDSSEAEDRAIFMTRLLFLLYADDVVGLWEPKAFERYIRNHTVPDGSDTGSALALLFQVLDTPSAKRSPNLPDDLAGFPYVNGHIFQQRPDIPYFTGDMRTALLRAVAIDWSGISPAIFGSLFQGLSTREERRVAGEHYTSEKNILKVIRPLFLDELEDRLQRAWSSTTELRKLRDHLGELRFLDPACGCGNFLIVAYREVARLEFQILKRVRAMHGDERQTLDPTWDLKVTPDHFAGIEVSWWPAKIAETAMFLTEHMVTQRLAELGEPPSILPITHSARIIHANALEVEWGTAVPAGDHTLVFGNPPFVGARVMDSTQKAELKRAWGEVPSADLDYVTAWYARAMDFLADSPQARFAFVSTNSIAQGVSATALFEPIFGRGWRIAFAHQTFVWTSEATGRAAVHCVIVGLAQSVDTAQLYSYPDATTEARQTGVHEVNGYLVAAPTVFVRSRSKPLSTTLPAVAFGSMANDGGALLVEQGDYAEVMGDPIAARYVRTFVGAHELIHNVPRWCLWLVEAPLEDLRASRVLRARLEQTRDHRAASSRASTRELASAPWLFGEIRQPQQSYVCIPRHVSENRPYFTVQRFEPEVICGDANFTAADPTGLLFSLISSRMFLLWQATVGGRIKSDFRFSSSIVWNNFPVPELTQKTREQLVAAGAEVRVARATHARNSLADLYDPLVMPSDLRGAHEALDRHVDSLFGLRNSSADPERLARLFELYAEMAGAK